VGHPEEAHNKQQQQQTDCHHQRIYLELTFYSWQSVFVKALTDEEAASKKKRFRRTIDDERSEGHSNASKWKPRGAHQKLFRIRRHGIWRNEEQRNE